MIDLPALADSCAPSVATATIVAIVSHESRRNPYAVGINGRTRISRQPLTKVEAIEISERLIAMGLSIDMGLAQINSANLPKLGLTVAQVFEPCTNLRAAETILHWCYDPAQKKYGTGQAALQAALSCYNTGNFNAGFTNGYVAKVYQAALNR